MNTDALPGLPVEVDSDAESAIEGMPAFLAAPKDAPVYYGFPILEGSERDGYVFGVITSPDSIELVRWGDAYVIAPDGSRAGIVWQAEGESEIVISPPSPGRWGVYGFTFAHPVRSREDLILNLHECLPQLKAHFERAIIDCPESTNGGVRT
jgi:hypothetical protein